MKKDAMDMRTPLVSIIVPVYNRRDLLHRAIRSVLNQTYGNFELIIVDDGSSEELKSTVDEFDDPRIKYIRHTKNMGICAARNTAMKAAAGDFMEFLDSDDEFLPEKTEKQLDALTKTGADAVYCGLWRECGGRNEYILQLFRHTKWFYLLQQLMVKKEVIDRVGFFDAGFVYAEDSDYVFRLSRICRFSGIPEPLMVLHDTPGSHTKKHELRLSFEELFLAKHQAELTPDEKSRRLYRLGKDYLRIGEIIRGYKSFFLSYTSYPLNKKALNKLVKWLPAFLVCLVKSRLCR